MKKFENPLIEIMEVDVEDIIVTSGYEYDPDGVLDESAEGVY